MQGNGVEGQVKIITDEASYQSELLDFRRYASILATIIKNSFPQFTVGIFGGWGMGKTTLMNMIMHELEKDEAILTVWFDAWRYEKEEHLAVIPFLRTIKLRLDEAEKSKIGKWGSLKKAVVRTAAAFLTSTKVTYGIKDIVTAETDFEKLANTLIGDGTIDNDNGVVYLHVTGFLEKSLKSLRKDNQDCRIVVFIDDLDRCTPQNGFEVLESIKSFFDIEGIVYVIGMNHKTIDFLVQKKFGFDPSASSFDYMEKTNITGFDYMKKIVQLPFHIPEWYKADITKFAEYTIKNDLKGSDKLQDAFIKNIEIVTTAIESNPREIKRFINAVILAHAVFDQLPIDNLIVIQALRFRNEWNKFLDFLSNDNLRNLFFSQYTDLEDRYANAINTIQGVSATLENVYQHGRETSEFEGSGDFKDLRSKTGFVEYYNVAKDIVSLYPQIEKDYPGLLLLRNPMNRFLNAISLSDNLRVKEKLAQINDMEIYRRALHTTDIEKVQHIS